MIEELLGPASVIGADSWLQAAYWAGGLLLALVAIRALRHRSNHSRAAVLLHLYERWEMLSDERSKFGREYKSLERSVFKEHPQAGKAQQMQKLRIACKARVERAERSERDLYTAFVANLSFFETVGLFVRHRYLPLRDAMQLYKGPIFDTDVMFRHHIEEWQGRANVQPGLFGNVMYLIRRARRRERVRSLIRFWE